MFNINTIAELLCENTLSGMIKDWSVIDPLRIFRQQGGLKVQVIKFMETSSYDFTIYLGDQIDKAKIFYIDDQTYSYVDAMFSYVIQTFC